MIILQVAGTGTTSLIMFGMIFAVMYFFMIRPQIKKQKKLRKYRSSLQKGDLVITIGGGHGKIIDVKNKTFIIEVHGGTKLKVEKTSISMNGDIGIDHK